MTHLLEAAVTMLCVDDNDRWGFWCKLCTVPGQTPDVIGNSRERGFARRSAKRHEERHEKR